MKLSNLSISVVLGVSLFAGTSQAASASTKYDSIFSNVKKVANSASFATEVCKCFDNPIKGVDADAREIEISPTCKVTNIEKIKTIDVSGSNNHMSVFQGVGHVQVNGKSENFPFFEVLVGKKGESKEGYIVSNYCTATVSVNKVS